MTDNPITLDQVTVILNFAPVTLCRYLATRQIPQCKIGNGIRFLLNELNEWVATRAMGTGNRK